MIVTSKKAAAAAVVAQQSIIFNNDALCTFDLCTTVSTLICIPIQPCGGTIVYCVLISSGFSPCLCTVSARVSESGQLHDVMAL